MTRDRLLLIPLLLWGLAMIAPDLLRVAHPLSSFGFYANNDGLVYDVTGPFAAEASSPAWQAGLPEGDRIDLSRLKCSLKDIAACSNALAALGGLQFVLPVTRSPSISLGQMTGWPRQVTLVAAPRPSNFLVRFVVILDQIAGILVVVAAAWLVWSRPSAMSWGFFLYVNWFNPGQSYAYYAILQQWPVLVLAQHLAGCVAQAAGYSGLLLFVIRAHNNKTEPRWRPVERALALVATVFALALIFSYGSLLGYHTETLTRAGIAAGFAVAICGGCCGAASSCYPPFFSPSLPFETTIFDSALGFTLPDEVIGLSYLVNGVLCFFVFEAVRSERVVSVWIPLRRVTILAFLFTAPTLFLRNQVQRVEEQFTLPGWAWLGVAVVVLFAISLLHDWAVDLADGFFNRGLDHHRASACRGYP
jgi:hypothetical protein